MWTQQAVALILCTLCATGVRADIFGSISNALNSATSSVTSTADNVASTVSSATGTAVNAVQGAVNSSTTAVQNAVSTVGHSAEHTVNISENWVSGTADTVSSAVVNFTDAQWSAASGAADQVASSISGVTGSAVSVGREAGGDITNDASSVTGTATPAAQAGVDATNPAAILASLTGAGGFQPVALGILQALADGQASSTADATAEVITNATGNATTQTGVAQAWATAMGIAQNDTADVHVNSTLVAEVFMASLQNAITPCGTNLKLSAQPDTEQYSQDVANSCCPVIQQTLSTEAMVSDLIGVEAPFYAALQNSDTFGTQPQINLGRCITQQTEVS